MSSDTINARATPAARQTGEGSGQGRWWRSRARAIVLPSSSSKREYPHAR
jgi:hypothetical protein